MAVNANAAAQGGVTLGGRFDLSQMGGASSPAMVSVVVFLVLLAVIVLITMGMR